MTYRTIDPSSIKLYHITHLENLKRIIKAGAIWSDAKRQELGLNCKIVGMSKIKLRRLEGSIVSCNPGTLVGQYVPFFFCPRSVMLYILYKHNLIELEYRGGQPPIIHLQVDMTETIQWAQKNKIPWAFSDINASARYAQFYNNIDNLRHIDWDAVNATDFRDPDVKDGKQAEFLVFESFPWYLVEKIGVIDQIKKQKVETELNIAEHKPLVSIEKNWYFL